MERYPHSQIVLKSLNVNKQLQQINFQIRHPENAINIIGIMVTCNLFADKRFNGAGQQVGTLTLSNSKMGDTCYSQALELDRNSIVETIERITFPTVIPYTYSKIGKRFTWFKSNIPIRSAIMEGFYSDTISKKYVDERGILLNTLPYEVLVYLQYEIKQP